MIGNLCYHLNKTYDTNLLDIYDKNIQKEFLNVSLKNRDNITNKGKKVLMKLICNHYDESVNKPTATFIGGPKTLSIHWHPVYKKLIYIFGEWHSNSIDCDKFEKDANTSLIEDYLYDLMLSTDVFLDIFFEFKSYKGGEYPFVPYPPSRQSELFKKFRKCLQYNTRSDASCNLARVHYFDIRDNDVNETNIEENKINILWFKFKLEYILLTYEKETKKDCVSYFKRVLQKYPKITNLLRELVQDDIKKVSAFMKKQLEENPYIKKEFDKIADNQLKRSILTFYGDLLSKETVRILSYIKQDILIILNNEKESDDILFNSIYRIELLFGSAMVYFSDVYLLGRMFKDFDMSEMEEKAYAGSTDQPINAHNIIIYCGNEHANSYRDFLSTIGFNDIEHTGDLREDISNQIPNTPKNCLDMKKIQQPFFTYKFGRAY